MTEAKSLWASGTVWGGVLASVSGIVQIAIVLTDPETVRLVTDSLTGLGAFAGGVLAILRRISATAKLV